VCTLVETRGIAFGNVKEPPAGQVTVLF